MARRIGEPQEGEGLVFESLELLSLACKGDRDQGQEYLNLLHQRKGLDVAKRWEKFADKMENK